MYYENTTVLYCVAMEVARGDVTLNQTFSAVSKLLPCLEMRELLPNMVRLRTLMLEK
jgi:hypothetical protein